MNATLGDSSTYRIETKTSAGIITDPVTDEQPEIEPYDEQKGGVIMVERPDSAKYIVDSSSRHRFLSDAPTTEAVREAQREDFAFAGSEVCESFARSRGDTLGEQELSPEAGFDPETDDATNGPKLKVYKLYNRLRSEGHDSEAGYLRALPSLAKQEAFVSHVRESGEISL